jgi:hypothetical protein
MDIYLVTGYMPSVLGMIAKIILIYFCSCITGDREVAGFYKAGHVAL